MASLEGFVQILIESGVLSAELLQSFLETIPSSQMPADGAGLAELLMSTGRLTPFQTSALLAGKARDLMIGNYLVLDRLGSGGMGTVYKAQHRRMKRVVAIKVLSRELTSSTQFAQRFQREVETVAQLNHPHIVMAHDADVAEAGHFLVMEYVAGSDLAVLVGRKGPLPVAQAVDYVTQAARALEYVHSRGIVHRDIKPANLMLDTQGMIKVTDLGLVRVAQPLDDSAFAQTHIELTQAFTIAGTVDYMVPEQAANAREATAAADIYSLGCTLFYLLTGRVMYSGKNVLDKVLAHREQPIPFLHPSTPGVSPALDLIYRRMVGKRLDDRYASMTEVIHDLGACLLESTAEHPHPGPLSDTLDGSDGGQGVVIRAGQGTCSGANSDTPAEHRSQRTLPTNLSVLLVEPSRLQSMMIVNQLKELGIAQVETATQGEAALERLRNNRADIVISSLHLRDITGVQLLERMRGDDHLCGVSFVLISSESEVQQLGAVAQSSTLAILAKPFDLTKLRDVLLAVCPRYRS